MEGKPMNAQLSLIANRQFWTGAAATFVVGFLVAIGVPNFMRTHMSTFEDKRNFAMRAQVQGMDMLAPAATDEDRKMVRTASMDLLVKSPKEVSEKIRMLALQAGGFLINSETYGGENASSASLTIRVPVDRFEQVRVQISKLGLRVESEKLEAQDVTKQYVDLSARLRNFRAQEAQYLGILKQAKTVKDTVDVSDKLNEVRGQIEQQQAEFDALSKQVATVALTITLHAESEAQVFGLHWRPLYQLKLAARDGIDGIGDYAAAMASFVFYVPAILLWLLTIAVGAAVGWRILRWTWRRLFVQLKTESAR
jgi:cell division protein FtsL